MRFSRRKSVFFLQKFDFQKFTLAFDPKTGFELVVRSGVSSSPTPRLENPLNKFSPGEGLGLKARGKKSTRG